MNTAISLYFLIPAVVFLLLVFPIVAEIRVALNPMTNIGVVALFVFGIKVFYYVVSYHGTYILLENEEETKKQQLEFSSQQFVFMQEFMRQMKDKIKLKKLYVFYNIGTGDAFSSALVCGLINLALIEFFVYLKSKKPTASLCVYDTVSYNKKEVTLSGRVQASISFFDVAYSFLNSLIITHKK